MHKHSDSESTHMVVLKNQKFEIFYGDQKMFLSFEIALILTTYPWNFGIVTSIFEKKIINSKVKPMKCCVKLILCKNSNSQALQSYVSCKMSQIRYFNSEMGKKSFLFPFKILVIWNRNYENLAQTWAFQKPKWQKKIWAQWIKYVFLKLFLLKNPGRRDIWQKKPFLGSGPDPKIWPQSNNRVKSYFTLEQSQTDRRTHVFMHGGEKLKTLKNFQHFTLWRIKTINKNNSNNENFELHL